MFDVDQQRRQALRATGTCGNCRELLEACLRKAGGQQEAIIQGEAVPPQVNPLCFPRVCWLPRPLFLSPTPPYTNSACSGTRGELTLPSSQQSSSAGGPLPPTLSPIKSSKGATREARRPTAESYCQPTSSFGLGKGYGKNQLIPIPCCSAQGYPVTVHRADP